MVTAFLFPPSRALSATRYRHPWKLYYNNKHNDCKIYQPEAKEKGTDGKSVKKKYWMAPVVMKIGLELVFYSCKGNQTMNGKNTYIRQHDTFHSCDTKLIHTHIKYNGIDIKPKYKVYLKKKSKMRIQRKSKFLKKKKVQTKEEKKSRTIRLIDDDYL